MPPRFIPVGGPGGVGGGFQGGGRFQPLGSGGAQIPQFFSARQPRFLPVSQHSAPSAAQPPSTLSPLPGVLGGAATLAGLGGALTGGNPVPPEGQSAGNISGAIGGGLRTAAGVLNLAEGRTVPGAIQTAGGLSQLAGNAPGLSAGASQGLGAAGSVLGAAGAGYALSQGDPVGGTLGTIGAIAPFLGAPIVGEMAGGLGLATSLIHGLALGADYTRGDLSKEIMQARQTALREGSVNAMNTALQSTPSYPQLLQVLGQIPPGTGQLQYGMGGQYTGETTLGGPQLTQTPGWQQTLAQAQQDPANFIKNFWVQTGQSGATSFDPGLTRQWQTQMIQSLPPGNLQAFLLDWAKNSLSVDPRDTQSIQDATSTYQQWLGGGRQGPSPAQQAAATFAVRQWAQASNNPIAPNYLPYPDMLSQLQTLGFSLDQATAQLTLAGLTPPPPPLINDYNFYGGY